MYLSVYVYVYICVYVYVFTYAYIQYIHAYVLSISIYACMCRRKYLHAGFIFLVYPQVHALQIYRGAKSRRDNRRRRPFANGRRRMPIVAKAFPILQDVHFDEQVIPLGQLAPPGRAGGSGLSLQGGPPVAAARRVPVAALPGHPDPPVREGPPLADPRLRPADGLPAHVDHLAAPVHVEQPLGASSREPVLDLPVHNGRPAAPACSALPVAGSSSSGSSALCVDDGFADDAALPAGHLQEDELMTRWRRSSASPTTRTMSSVQLFRSSPPFSGYRKQSGTSPQRSCAVCDLRVRGAEQVIQKKHAAE